MFLGYGDTLDSMQENLALTRRLSMFRCNQNLYFASKDAKEFANSEDKSRNCPYQKHRDTQLVYIQNCSCCGMHIIIEKYRSKHEGKESKINSENCVTSRGFRSNCLYHAFGLEKKNCQRHNYQIEGIRACSRKHMFSDRLETEPEHEGNVDNRGTRACHEHETERGNE